MTYQNMLADYVAQHKQQASEYEFIKTHGTAYYGGHTWNDRDGSTTSVRSGPHATSGEANAAIIEMLRSCGYTAPRWWQYWRWGERVPNGWEEGK